MKWRVVGISAFKQDAEARATRQSALGSKSLTPQQTSREPKTLEHTDPKPRCIQKMQMKTKRSTIRGSNALPLAQNMRACPSELYTDRRMPWDHLPRYCSHQGPQ